MKKVIYSLVLIVISVIGLLSWPNEASAFTPINEIISDYNFRNYSTMTEAQIQEFLASNNSYLANYTIPPAYYDSAGYYRGTWIGPIGYEVDSTGWRASRVIYMASQWYNLNPQVVIATIQKEQSLITMSYFDDRAIRWTMGYAVTDSGIVSACGTDTNRNDTGSCAGLAMQIDWGAGTLVYRYNVSNPNFPVGSTKLICYTYGSTDCAWTYISNRATSSLYSYTPYYHGNFNFRYIYSLWFNSYDYQFVSAVNPPPNMAAGSTVLVQAHLRNTGGSTWYNEAEYAADPVNKRPMRLAVINADGQNFFPNNDTWVDSTRIAMTSASVGTGQIGSFNFVIKAPLTPGTHVLRYLPVVEGVQALKDIGMQFVVNVSYDYQFVSAVNPPPNMAAGSTVLVQAHLRNTGGSTWYNEAEYAADPVNKRPMRLAVINADGQNFFPNNDTWVDSTRIAMTSASVGTGQIGSFNFVIKAPLTPGTHVLRYLPVVEGVQALKDIGMQFVVNVSYDYQFVSAVNPPPNMAAGSTVLVQAHLRNTGGSTWYNEAEYAADPVNKRPMRLAVINADGQNFFPNNDTWVDSTRIAMTSASVGTGQIGSFNFVIKAPLTPGTHVLRYLPVVEGVQALKDIGMQFVVNVY